MSSPYAYRGPGGEIDLEEALGAHLRHYVGIMAAGANGSTARVLTLGSEVPGGLLVRQGYGLPTRASSRGDLAALPEWSWDVCGYYVSLGVHWTATKREVRVAYKKIWMRTGVQDEYLTYVVSQLTDDRVRFLYDITPLGGVFLLDKYVAARIKRKAAAEASRRMAEGEEASAEEVLEEMGLREQKPPAGEGEDAGDVPQEPRESRWGLWWGHYVLAGPQGSPRGGTGVLEAWQGMVAAALRERGIAARFAVAQGSEKSPLVLRDSKEPCIFVLTENEASPEKANEAVELGIDLGIVTIVTYNSERHLHAEPAKGHQEVGRACRGEQGRRLLPHQDALHEGRRGTVVPPLRDRPRRHGRRRHTYVLRHQAEARAVQGRQVAGGHARRLHERQDVPDSGRKRRAHRRVRARLRRLLHSQPGPGQAPRREVPEGQVHPGQPDVLPRRRPRAHPRRALQAPPGVPGRHEGVHAGRRHRRQGPALRRHQPEAPQLLERGGGRHLHGGRPRRRVRLPHLAQGKRLQLLGTAVGSRPGPLPGQRGVEALHRRARPGRLQPRRGDHPHGVAGLVRPLVRRGRGSQGRLRPQGGRGAQGGSRSAGRGRPARPGQGERFRQPAPAGPHPDCRIGLTLPLSPARLASRAGLCGPREETMAFADLHVHSEYSVLDGESTTAEIAARVAENGGTAAALTDHGGCFGHVQWQRDADAAGIKPVFGIETYFQPDRLARPPKAEGLHARRDELLRSLGAAAAERSPEFQRVERELKAVKECQAELRNGDHLILLAQGDRGLHDLWAASTEAYVTGFYGKPRMDWEVLEEYGSDLICTTACLGGVVADDVKHCRVNDVIAKLDRLKAIFPGRLYLEVQGNELPDQIFLNQALAQVSEIMGIPMVATCDAHYPSPAEKELHRQWMMCQSGNGKDDYWHFSPMLTEQALRDYLGYLDPAVVEQAIRNTAEIAGRCDARIGGHADPPVFTPGGTADDDARALRAMCDANRDAVPASREYRDREDYEFEVVVGKGLAGCYLIVDDLIRFARSQGFLVGPGRGSDAGSLISYRLGITSVDPIRAGLLFERFLTPGRESLPDFDLDFQSSARTPIQDYAVDRYGADHVVRVGTIMRYGTKGIINKLASAVYSDRYGDDVIADAKLIGKIVDQAEAGTAGLGLSWSEHMENPDIAEYREKYPDLFETAGKLVGRVYAQGQHPAGLIISPGRVLTGSMPMRHVKPGDKLLVSQWDYRAAEDLNLLKLDILTLRTLDTISLAVDLVEKRTGVRLDPRAWDIEHLDPQVYDGIGTGSTLGVFQVETRLCSDYARRMKPRTLADLADLTTFIRPGPRNSGATERYLARRAGSEEVDYPHPDLADMLCGSYGVMLYQEDVMRACKIVAGYSDLEADGVRRLMGKKQVSKIEAAGQEFVRRSVERGHDEQVVSTMWEAMAEFGRYAFNKAHGFSYGVLSYWTAWLKEHYPAEFLTAVMSTVDADRLPDFATEARRIGLAVLPPDVSYCQDGFTCQGITLRYGLRAIPGVGGAAVRKITAAQPYESYEDFIARSGADKGVVYALAKAGALDALVPSRKGLVRVIESDRDGTSVRCVHKTDDPLTGGSLPCSFDWEGDQAEQEARHAELMAPRVAGGKKPLKLALKPPPARCTRACRRYTPPSLPGMAAWGEYTPSALFRSDMEMYGTWMSDAVFGRLDELLPGLREQAREMARALATAPPGAYPAAAVVADVHPATTRNGSTMWWVKLLTEVSALDLACFSPRRDDEFDVPAAVRGLRPGTLVQAQVRKRTYLSRSGPRMGWNLTALYPLGD